MKTKAGNSGDATSFASAERSAVLLMQAEAESASCSCSDTTNKYAMRVFEHGPHQCHESGDVARPTSKRQVEKSVANRFFRSFKEFLFFQPPSGGSQTASFSWGKALLTSAANKGLQEP